MHAFSHVICICIRVAVAAEEIVYEVVAEPQEIVRNLPKAQFTLALSSRRKASPGACPIILNYNTYMYVFITCALRFRSCLCMVEMAD